MTSFEDLEFLLPQWQMDQDRPLGLRARHKAYISSYAPCLLPGHRWPFSVPWFVRGAIFELPESCTVRCHTVFFFPVVVISAMVSCWSRSYYHIALGGMEKVQSDPGEQKDGTTVSQKLCGSAPWFPTKIAADVHSPQGWSKFWRRWSPGFVQEKKLFVRQKIQPFLLDNIPILLSRFCRVHIHISMLLA